MRHFEEELAELKSKLLEMSGLVESAIFRSVTALTTLDRELAKSVISNEEKINLMEIEIDDAATRLLALHQPMASDLRFLTAAIKINNDLERMGDLAVKIAERALSLMEQPPVKPEIDIPQVARLAESMVRRSLDAFVKRDSELARSVLTADDEVDDLRSAIYEELIRNMQAEPATIPQCVNLMSVVRSLERIADHSTNIAEDVLYLVEGIDVRHHAETKRH
ncbi:MAG: phosphate transport system regulatory protein PhoU [Acidobacteria bacterium]|nr:MAG: phosphate transport system regulatory protein PhoU [Acidobacteriota bacterium]